MADPRDDYLAALAASVPGERPLAGLRIALDPANGAASSYAGPLFTMLGAAVTTLCAEPDGRNINLGCGSTAPERLAAFVADGADGVGGAFDLGIAFDGDADRAILVDEGGRIHDGDAILYLWASALRAAGELDPPTIAVTSMSNFGLERALARHGVGVVRCGVGDRQVVETMRRDGLAARRRAVRAHRPPRPRHHRRWPAHRGPGGGDRAAGRAPALRTASPRSTASPSCWSTSGWRPSRRSRRLPRVAAAARAVEARLGAEGRLVLRYSGTEPLARVMVEGPDQAVIEALAEELAAAIRAEIGSER